MMKKIRLTEKYLQIPVSLGQPVRVLEIYDGDAKVFEAEVPAGPDGAETAEPDALAQIPLPKLAGRELLLQGEFPETFWAGVFCTGTPIKRKETRPAFHMTAEIGWINDPNGLVYENGVYHYYFQYNPLNTEWGNMSWGHATSCDLLHWTQEDTVLLPEADGMIFSGSALLPENGQMNVPEGAIAYYYTVAGGIAAWSKGKPYIQKMAYSIDHGRTLVQGKMADGSDWSLAAVAPENRDPKVFWHEESGAYIMIFWVQDHEFILLRSTDGRNWRESQRFSLEDGFECPDLVCLHGENGSCWVIFTAAGYYYPGDFDGYTFRWHGYKKCLYKGAIQYAGQTYAGVNERVIFVPWLQLKHPGRCYRGASGLPRELSLIKETDGTFSVVQKPVCEYEEQKVETDGTNGFAELAVTCQEGAVFGLELLFAQKEIPAYGVEYMRETGIFAMGDERVCLHAVSGEFRFIFDDTILEIIMDDGRKVGAYELPAPCIGIRCRKAYGCALHYYQLPERDG